MNKKLIGAGVAAVLLVAGVAAIASYTTREYLQTKTEAKHEEKQNRKMASAQQAQPRCDDSNIVGTVAGGAAGGIVGNQFGRGGGKTAATIGGVLGGAYLGNKYIPTRDVTCPH